MIHHSPLPDVEIPDLPLTEYVLAGGTGRPDKPALIDGASGRVMTYGGCSAIPPGPDPLPLRAYCGVRAFWTACRWGH
jgi:hypothetical protein